MLLTRSYPFKIINAKTKFLQEKALTIVRVVCQNACLRAMVHINFKENNYRCQNKTNFIDFDLIYLKVVFKIMNSHMDFDLTALNMLDFFDINHYEYFVNE